MGDRLGTPGAVGTSFCILYRQYFCSEHINHIIHPVVITSSLYIPIIFFHSYFLIDISLIFNSAARTHASTHAYTYYDQLMNFSGDTVSLVAFQAKCRNDARTQLSSTFNLLINKSYQGDRVPFSCSVAYVL